MPWIFTALAALGQARAGDPRPEVPVVVPDSGTVLGRLARTDGGFPFLSEAAADRTACMLNPRWVRIRQLRAIAARAGRDRDGAYADMIRVTGACMDAKGWVFMPCPATGEGCSPSSNLAGEAGGG